VGLGTHPCAVDADICRALNWNNLLFNVTQGGLVDGYDIVFTQTPRFMLNLTAAVSDVDVEMRVNRTEAGFILLANEKQCTPTGSSSQVNTWSCLFSDIRSLRFTRSPLVNAQMREVRAFLHTDTGRVDGYF
jgi:hypothetical protein